MLSSTKSSYYGCIVTQRFLVHSTKVRSQREIPMENLNLFAAARTECARKGEDKSKEQNDARHLVLSIKCIAQGRPVDFTCTHSLTEHAVVYTKIYK